MPSTGPNCTRTPDNKRRMANGKGEGYLTMHMKEDDADLDMEIRVLAVLVLDHEKGTPTDSKIETRLGLGVTFSGPLPLPLYWQVVHPHRENTIHRPSFIVHSVIATTKLTGGSRLEAQGCTYSGTCLAVSERTVTTYPVPYRTERRSKSSEYYLYTHNYLLYSRTA